uniref:EamA domain-containing protein n=1 Tax=Kalanchoe fedtschenkoi TaxID=63787 RepID=A0A7N0RI12_KALFE
MIWGNLSLIIHPRKYYSNALLYNKTSRSTAFSKCVLPSNSYLRGRGSYSVSMGLRLEELKPALAMIGLQFSYAGVALLTRAALLKGMSTPVFVFYRQSLATLVMAPVAFLSSGRYSRFWMKRSAESSMGLRSFGLIFLASLIGVTMNQNVYFEGLYLASSSMASAMSNLTPAVTFVVAFALGFEKLKLRSLRSIAKIFGTMFCVSGAMCMALLRGPKLLNLRQHHPLQSINNLLFGSSTGGDEEWFLGSEFLFASSCCWSTWLILQVPVSKSYPDHVSLSAWMCFMATIQSGVYALFMERDPEAWILHSNVEFGCIFFAGIIGSALSFFVQSWVISKRGPLFAAMFNPLATVTTTILAFIVLHEQIYTGSLVGALAVIAGLYIVLWGKARDYPDMKGGEGPKPEADQDVQILIEESVRIDSRTDLEEPLLDHEPDDPSQCEISNT